MDPLATLRGLRGLIATRVTRRKLVVTLLLATQACSGWGGHGSTSSCGESDGWATPYDAGPSLNPCAVEQPTGDNGCIRLDAGRNDVCTTCMFLDAGSEGDAGVQDDAGL